MGADQSRRYNTVDFPDYLDNGQFDVTLPLAMLQLSVPKICNIKTLESSLSVNLDPTANKKNWESRPWLIASYSRICNELIGKSVIGVEFPGGSHRSSCRINIEGGSSVIATRRNASGRAQLESRILAQLYNQEAPVPAPLGFNGVVLLQEDIPGTRLSEAITSRNGDDLYKLLSQGLQSLATIQQKASLSGLDEVVPVTGCSPDWLISFLDRTAVIGGFLGLPCPHIPVEAFYDLLAVMKPRFVKWDARPGNAIINERGGIKWFDWEHCCARNRLDDMVWFLCDESIPDSFPELEDRLIEEYLPAFADGRPLEEALVYLRIFGILHLCVRLGRILHAKGRGSWDDADRTLDKPKGSSFHSAQRLCARASFWSAKIPYTDMLPNWFGGIYKRLQEI